MRDVEPRLLTSNMCSSVFLFATAVAALLTVIDGSWIDGNDGIDRPKGDLPGMPIILDNEQSASVCAQLCASNTQCKAWSFYKSDCGHPSCYLKDSISQQSYNPCMVKTSPLVMDYYNICLLLQISGLKNTRLISPAFRALPLGAIQPTGVYTMRDSCVTSCYVQDG